MNLLPLALVLAVGPVAQDPEARRGRLVTELDPRVWCIEEVRNGDLWVGSDGGGVYRYDGERVTQFTGADGLSGDFVRDIAEDRAGNVLVSTTEGVSRFDGATWTDVPVEVHPAGAGWRLDPDDVWIVHEPDKGGASRYDGETLHRLALPESPAEEAYRARYPDTDFAPDGVYTVYRDRRGHVWFGTASVGLCRYDGRTHSWMYEDALTTTPGGGAFGIRSIHEDEAGDFWICNTRQRFRMSAEAARGDGPARIDYEKLAGLPDARADEDRNFTYCMAIAGGAAGALWMACGSDGVWRYDGERVERVDLGDGVFARCLLRDRAGRVWVGTLAHGLHVFDGQGFEPFEPMDAGD